MPILVLFLITLMYSAHADPGWVARPRDPDHVREHIHQYLTPRFTPYYYSAAKVAHLLIQPNLPNMIQKQGLDVEKAIATLFQAPGINILSTHRHSDKNYMVLFKDVDGKNHSMAFRFDEKDRKWKAILRGDQRPNGNLRDLVELTFAQDSSLAWMNVHQYDPDVLPIETLYANCERNPDGLPMQHFKQVSEDLNRVIIAVIDNGFDYNHPKLSYRLVRETEPDGSTSVGRDFFGQDNLPYAHADFGRAHGTGVASVAAQGDERVAILPIEINMARLGESIAYAREKGARVVVMSFGGSDLDSQMKQIDDAMKDEKYKDMVFVAAAGNDFGRDNDKFPVYPASFRNSKLISVAAVDADDRLASFSNQGRESVHVAAPGINVPVITLNGGSGVESGTSIAAPYVAYVAARVMQARPNLTGEQTVAILRESVRKPENADWAKELEEKTAWGGIVDLQKALERVIGE